VAGELGWARRHLLMRIHTALHVLCGVVWSEFAIPVTGGNTEPGSGRLDFLLESISVELGRRLEARINEELAAARPSSSSSSGLPWPTPTPPWSLPRRTRFRGRSTRCP